MTIIFHPESGIFHLFNQQISYVLHIAANHQLEQIYYGAAIHDRAGLADLSLQPVTFDAKAPDIDVLDRMRQEYPSFGTGDMHQPAFSVEQPDGSTVSDYRYDHYRILAGKPKLNGLPATYTDHEDEAQTLEITLIDVVAHAQIVLLYSIYSDLPVIVRSARFAASDTPLIVRRALSMSIDLPDQNYQLIELNGAWARERNITRRQIQPGITAVESLRGHSSAQFNPFIALTRPETTENSGAALGFCLVYSGNFLAQVQADTMNNTRVSMGIHPLNFAWHLDVDGPLQTPEVVMVYSDAGLNGMSQTYHHLFASRLVRGQYRQKPRPILLNNWEATYFDFDEAKLLKIAETAKQVGVELFVLDDGWFGERRDDYRGLGDWQANLTKLPGGITQLANKITQMGLQFGLWFEPEMVNADSQLYREHPDWILKTPHRTASVGRHQYVLDMSKPAVVDNLFAQVSAILANAPVTYVKWDMNRSLSEVYSQGQSATSQGSVYHRFILGVYALYERLIQAFPDVLFESCASGGGRFDAGMLYYAPQAWASDNTDAVARQAIQYGTSLAYPISSIGAHVSAVPNHQVGRITPLDTRANVAYFGTFGYELDLNRLSATELATVKQQISFMKAQRDLIQNGTFYRLLSPFAGNETAWMVVSADQKQALVGYYQTLAQANQPAARYLPLAGLAENSAYQIDGQGVHFGSELMHAGLRAEFNDNQDFCSRLYRLTAVNGDSQNEIN